MNSKTLPIEIIDRIFMYTDIETVFEARELQSEYFKNIIKYKTVEDCIKNSDLRNLIFIVKQNDEDTEIDYAALDLANQINDLEILKFLHQECHLLDNVVESDLILNAIIKGNLESLKWLHSIGCSMEDCECNSYDSESYPDYECDCGDSFMDYAAKFGTLEILKWFHLEQNIKFSYDVMEDATENGNLEMMKWVLEQQDDFYYDESVFYAATRKGIIENMEWLLENNFPFDNKNFNVAVEYSKLEAIKWLYSKGLRPDNNTFSLASHVGDLEMMKWLYEIECPREDESSYFHIAAKNGNLEAMEWMKEKGFAYNSDLFCAAACLSRFEILEWLHMNDFPCDLKAWNLAYSRNNIKVALWLVNNGYPYNKKEFKKLIKTSK